MSYRLSTNAQERHTFGSKSAATRAARALADNVSSLTWDVMGAAVGDRFIVVAHVPGVSGYIAKGPGPVVDIRLDRQIAANYLKAQRQDRDSEFGERTTAGRYTLASQAARRGGDDLAVLILFDRQYAIRATRARAALR